MSAADLPGFVARPVTAVSGRLLTTLGMADGTTSPCTLEAHYLPACRGLGSAVYVNSLVGPSDGSFPFYPVGGVIVGEGSMQLLQAVSESYYDFDYTGDPIEFDTFEIEIEDVDSLIAAVLLVAAEKLELARWDDEAASALVEASRGWDYFEDFMALDVQEFPRQ
jgi:hypothetical protein